MCVHGQVTGDDLQGIDMDELREISPKRTRVEYKLLLQMIRNIEAASQVCSLWLCIRRWECGSVWCTLGQA